MERYKRQYKESNYEDELLKRYIHPWQAKYIDHINQHDIKEIDGDLIYNIPLKFDILKSFVEYETFMQRSKLTLEQVKRMTQSQLIEEFIKIFKIDFINNIVFDLKRLFDLNDLSIKYIADNVKILYNPGHHMLELKFTRLT